MDTHYTSGLLPVCLSGSSSLLSFGCGQVAWLNSAVVWQLISDLVCVHYLNVNHIIIVELVDVPRGTAGCTQGDQSPGNMEHLEKLGKSKVVKGKWKSGKRLGKLKWVANIRYCIVFIQSNFYLKIYFFHLGVYHLMCHSVAVTATTH